MVKKLLLSPSPAPESRLSHRLATS
ncbi:unnamed protein product [Linum tenue]|uniref:Uncharacterized protein n=1 Tax=Linum tenue TaxID=586396 RepID=A0AAV0S026_9ROSI|nr:unnamed protein product [Linum tenue]